VGAALNIGSLYLDLRYPDDAAPFFEHVLDLDPENELARAKLDMARNLARLQPEASRRRHREEARPPEPPPEPSRKKRKRRPFTNLEL